MKLIPVLLGVSLAVNAALAVVVLQHSGPETAGAAELSSSRGDTRAGSDGLVAKMVEAKAAEAAKAAGSWSTLSGGTLADMVARLRAAGYPSSAIRALVYARLSDQMAARRRELMATVEEVPYWKTGANMFNPKVNAAQREFYQEQQKILRELLGADATEDNEISQYYRRRQFGDISPEKAEELQRISSDYNELRQEIYAKANGLLMPEDREQMAFLEKELRNDFAKVMTPQELENYDLRSSTAANLLRSQLTTFQPSEAEFRALYQVARAMEDKFGSLQGMTRQDQMQQRQKFMEEEAKRVLTPDRFAEFAQAIDPKNAMLNRVVARYQLPATVVPQVTAVQEDVQKRMGAVRSLKGPEQAAQAAALAAEAEAKIKPLLGEQAFEAYRVYGGQWLDRLKQPPTPPPPPGTRG